MKYIYWYLIILNVWGFFLYAYDKAQAIRHKKRISEQTLLLVAMLGGVFNKINF